MATGMKRVLMVEVYFLLFLKNYWVFLIQFSFDSIFLEGFSNCSSIVHYFT